MFNNHVDFSKIIVKVSLTGLLGTLLLITSTVYVLSQMNGIEISPSHTQEVPSGQIVAYDHVLTNNTTFTDTFSLEAHSTQGWPVELLGEGYPTGTLMLPLQVSAQMTASFQVSLTVPLSVSGVTEITVITATSQISPTVWDTATDTTIVLSQIYLPLVVKRWPPIPYQPSIYPIGNADGDGNYSVSWTEQPSRLADTYTLQEATNPDFTTGQRKVCTTAQQFCEVTGRLAGTYYYRVQGHNTWGYGTYSKVEAVTVLLPGIPILNAIDNVDGDENYIVSWSAAERATSYTLQEDTVSNFESPTIVYRNDGQSWWATNQAPGTYYYRVQANGPTGQSEWSDTQLVIVPSPPLAIGDSVRFKSWLSEVPLEGVVTDSEYRSVLYPNYGDPVYPGGVFVVVLMDVTNHGLESGEVGYYSSFRVEDNVGRRFDMAELEALLAAKDEYNRESIFYPIQPGFTKPLVFVFDVLPESQGLHLISLSPW